MPHYSSERKAAVLKKLLPPESRAVTEVSKEECYQQCKNEPLQQLKTEPVNQQ